MFLPLGARPFFPRRLDVFLLLEAADDVLSAVLNTLIIERKAWHKNRNLQHEIASDSKRGNEAEISERGNIGEHANDERTYLASGSSKDAWSNFFHGVADSVVNAGDDGWDVAFCSGYQEHVVDTDGQNQERDHLSGDHCELLVKVER